MSEYIEKLGKLSERFVHDYLKLINRVREKAGNEVAKVLTKDMKNIRLPYPTKDGSLIELIEIYAITTRQLGNIDPNTARNILRGMKKEYEKQGWTDDPDYQEFLKDVQ